MNEPTNPLAQRIAEQVVEYVEAELAKGLPITERGSTMHLVGHAVTRFVSAALTAQGAAPAQPQGEPCSTCGGNPASHPSGAPCICADSDWPGTMQGEVYGLRRALYAAPSEPATLHWARSQP